MRIILNPMSRNGAARRVQPEIERALRQSRVDFDIVHSEGPGHAVELARAAAEAGIERIVAAGGDGTVHEVANGILSARTAARPALGLIPIGTGNDFVKMVPGTNTREQALATLAHGQVGTYDVGRAEWNGGTEYFTNAMGTGIDVEVVRLMRRRRFVPGAYVYISAVLRALTRYRPVPVRIEVDGDVVEQRIMLLAIANGACIGGTFNICPAARPDDGWLDVCLVEAGSLPRNARLVPRVIRGTHEGREGVTTRRGRNVRMSSRADGPLFFQLDGELRHTADSIAGVTITLEPQRLHVINRSANGATAP